MPQLRRITLKLCLVALRIKNSVFYHLPTWGRAGIKLGDAWYVSNVSIIFYCSMLYYILFWTLLGFIIHFYIIFGTNLLTRGPAQNCCFFAYFRVSQKKNIKRSPNGMKPSGTWFSERTWSRGLGPYVKTSTRRARGRGRAYPPRRALHPRGPHLAPPTYSFLLYIPTYPQMIRYGGKTLIPPPQLSVSTRSHLGAFTGALPVGESTMEGFYINTIAPPMSCE